MGVCQADEGGSEGNGSSCWYNGCAERFGRANRQRLSEYAQKPHFLDVKMETIMWTELSMVLEVNVAAIVDRGRAARAS